MLYANQNKSNKIINGTYLRANTNCYANMYVYNTYTHIAILRANDITNKNVGSLHETVISCKKNKSDKRHILQIVNINTSVLVK